MEAKEKITSILKMIVFIIFNFNEKNGLIYDS